MKVSEVIFREDLYPRSEKYPAIVQKYSEDLSVLPPVEVNQKGELIDGWHRWTAHLKAKATEISVIVTETTDDAHLLELAVERNSKFGQQLSTHDKKRVARRIYRATEQENRGPKKYRLAELLSLSYDTIHKWMLRIDKDEEEERHCAVQNLWLQCYTQDEIAKAVGMPRKTVGDLLARICKYEIPPIPGIFSEDLPDDSATQKVKDKAEKERAEKIVQDNKTRAEHEQDFDVPIYNVWKQQTKTSGSGHFGNSEIRWVDNLLYLYTEPFDIIVDPFAGSGSTLDICKKRLRRCWVSDLIPIPERENEIRQLDITIEGLPDLRKRWPEVSLVYLDPPYWKQAEGEYSDSPNDLSNMSLDLFNKTLSTTITALSKKLRAGARIALIIQPTQWKTNDLHEYTDHVADMLRLVDLPLEMRYSVPYESQQCNAQMVEWAKENKECLVLTREIIVWRCGR